MEPEPHQKPRDRIVIIGAGFGGFQAAQSLAGTDAEVLLIDRHNYHTFVPLLYQVATAQLEPSLVAYPIRTKLRGRKNVRFLQAQVNHLDVNHQRLETDVGSVPYDYLVVATGTQPNYHNVPQAPDHTFPLKTLGDAIALREHFLTCFETAALTTDPIALRRLMTFTIVGGGATGVEVAGALAEWLRGAVRRDFPALAHYGRIVLIQSGASLLPEFSQRLGNYAHRHLNRMGVDVHLNVKLTKVSTDHIKLSDQTLIDTATVVWGAGLEATYPTVSQSVDQAAQGKLVVNERLQVNGYSHIYAIGDVAYFEKNGQPLSGVAPEALQQGVFVARNLCRQLQGKPLKPFRYLNKGRLAIIGGYGGVGHVAGIDLGGFGAWFLWLMVHVIYLPGYRSRLVVLLTWVQNYVMGDRPVRQQFSRMQRP
jgi:NADH dehydrogenase